MTKAYDERQLAARYEASNRTLILVLLTAIVVSAVARELADGEAGA